MILDINSVYYPVHESVEKFLLRKQYCLTSELTWNKLDRPSPQSIALSELVYMIATSPIIIIGITLYVSHNNSQSTKSNAYLKLMYTANSL